MCPVATKLTSWHAANGPLLEAQISMQTMHIALQVLRMGRGITMLQPLPGTWA